MSTAKFKNSDELASSPVQNLKFEREDWALFCTVEGLQQKADAVVTAAKQAMAPYEDYHKALADGYEIFLPDVPQPQYHFTRYEYGLEARLHFDPLKPTSLLY